MTIPFGQDRYVVRFAAGPADVLACQRLRHACFFGGHGIDCDMFDGRCRHLMVTAATGRLVATVRLFEMNSGADIDLSYAAQSYDLEKLSRVTRPMIEIGRFCVADDVVDADVLRVAWAALTQIVDARRVAMLFGCTSFAGTDPMRYGQVFARLHARYLGPDHYRPQAKVPAIPLDTAAPVDGDPMPPLLRTYLAMGGWVGDQAVIDHAMNTLHVFTCLEVAKVPDARARALRALAKACPLA